MRIAFVTPSLRRGGAERFLVDLALNLVKLGHEVLIINLGSSSESHALRLQNQAQRLNLFCVRDLGVIRGLLQARVLLKSFDPDVMQTWMYLGDLVGGLLARSVDFRNVWWSVRNSIIPRRLMGRASNVAFQLCRMMAPKIPAGVISCSETALKQHISRGFNYRSSFVIPNSVPSWVYKYPVRNFDHTWLNKPLRVGMAARYVPGKGHEELVRVAKNLRGAAFDVKVKFVGSGDPSRLLRRKMYSTENLEPFVTHEGEREDMATWYSDIDLYVMASTAWEGFPNSVLEAAALGIPTYARNIGDAAQILPSEFVFRTDNELLNLLKHFMTNEAAGIAVADNAFRVRRDFELNEISQRYLAAWTSQPLV